MAIIFFSKALEIRTGYSIADRLFLRFLSPPLELTSLGISRVVRLWQDYLYLVNLKKENAFLKEYIEKLELQNQILREVSVENNRLRELLSFKKGFAYDMLPAEIIGRDPSSWFKTILINKGSHDGVERGLGVITPQGVVGKVVAVAPTTADTLQRREWLMLCEVAVRQRRRADFLALLCLVLRAPPRFAGAAFFFFFAVPRPAASFFAAVLLLLLLLLRLPPRFGRSGGQSMVPRHCAAPQRQANTSSMFSGSSRSR